MCVYMYALIYVVLFHYLSENGINFPAERLFAPDFLLLFDFN